MRRHSCGWCEVIGAWSCGWRPRVATFVRDTRAAAAVEFAIVSLPFFAVTFLIMLFALYHISLQSLDNATKAAARKVMLGSITEASRSSGGFMNDLLCPNLFIKLPCSDLTVRAFRMADIGDQGSGTGLYSLVDFGTKTIKTDAAPFCLGGPGDFVYLEVSYKLPNFVRSLLVGETSEFMLMQSSVYFKNEPTVGSARAC